MTRAFATLVGIAVLCCVPAGAQPYNRGIAADDIVVNATGTPGVYSIAPIIRLVNGTNGSLDLSTAVEISVNGTTVSSQLLLAANTSGGQTCNGSCPGNCRDTNGPQSNCADFARLFGGQGCACEIVVGATPVNCALSPGDFIAVWITQAPGAAVEVHDADDYAQRVFALSCATLISGVFSSDRFGALPNDRMQIVAYYDGNGTADLDIHLTNPTTNACCIITVAGIPNSPFTVQEYVMNGFVPTGKFDVRNVVPNGVVDGIAFGLYWRDAAGARWKLQSRSSATGSGTPNFVGMWPYGWSDATFDAAMPTIVDDGFKKQQARVTLAGAQVLGNGTWGIPTGRFPADTNSDGCVDLLDLTTLLSSFGACCP